MIPFRRVRLTTAKRIIADTWLEYAPDARLGKLVIDLPPSLAERYIAAQEAMALATQQLHAYREANR